MRRWKACAQGQIVCSLLTLKFVPSFDFEPENAMSDGSFAPPPDETTEVSISATFPTTRPVIRRPGVRRGMTGPISAGIACMALGAALLSSAVSAQQAPPPAGLVGRPRPALMQPPGAPTPADGPGANAAQSAVAGPPGVSAPADPGATVPTTAPATQPAIKRPMPQPIPVDPKALTDEKIGETIKKGVNFLYGQIDPKTHTVAPQAGAAGAKPDGSYDGGLDALVVYSLMQCSLATGEDDPRIATSKPEMRAMVAAMENYNLNVGDKQTYAHGLRATALALYISTLHLPEGKDAKPNADSLEYGKAVKVLEEDTEYGLLACDGGAYTYVKHQVDPKKTDDPFYDHRDLKSLLASYRALNPNNLPLAKGGWDNSNSQYGLLGVWSAVDAEVGIEIPIQYWALVNHHWETCQLHDGGWGYSRGEAGPGGGQATLTMTCAGLASEFVTHEYLEPVQIGDKPGRIPFSPAIKKGLEWFEKGSNCITGAPGNGYALYGVERVGLASGFKFFGQHDWYRELAAHAVTAQAADGSFVGQWGLVPNTAYYLLFLSRGRHPIVMNKLRFDTDGNKGIGYWLNRPQDASNLARYVGHQLENPLNWQVINVDTDWTQWLDSPILEIASQKEVKFTTEQLDKLRSYVESGGMLYLQADGDSPEFNRMVPKLAHDLFPKYELSPVPPDHPMYGIVDGVYKLMARPDLKMVYNGSRILLLWSPRDISKYWQQRDVVRHKLDFEFGANMFVYAVGKHDLRNRLDSPYVAPVTAAPIATIKVARIDYAGNADPEPGAWRRYVNYFQNQTGTKLALSTVKLGALMPGDAPIAHLTGTAKYTFSPADIAAIKAYVEGGGVLVIDQCGGTGQFDQSVNTMLGQAFPGIAAQTLSPMHPMLLGGTPGTEDLSHYKQARYRKSAVSRGMAHGTGLEIIAAGKGHVIFTPMDITSGLMDTATGGILGFDPAYSEALMKNIIFWAVDGQSDK
jgi:hypothetical protein